MATPGPLSLLNAALTASTTLAKHETPLTWNEALSGIFGSISLAAWIFLLVPQLIENYRQQSAHGISLTFLLVWFAGDVTNLLGAAWAQLVPTVIALAVYFCFADTVLITQCVYYNSKNARAEARAAKNNAASSTSTPEIHHSHADDTTSEEEPLLRRSSTNTSAPIGLPGSHRRDSQRSRRPSTLRRHSSDALARIIEDPGLKGRKAAIRAALRNAVAILLVCAAGTAGWALAWQAGVWRPAAPPGHQGDHTQDAPVGAEILGYASALLYLGARLPQIYHNWRVQSCDGLSLLFFLLSLLGNATYGAGILFHSLQSDYVWTNLPWLIGSLGTMAEDVVIFIQFHLYGDATAEDAVEEEAVGA